MANVGMLIKIDRKGRRLRQVEIPLFLNNSPYAEPWTGVSARKVAKAEWSALR